MPILRAGTIVRHLGRTSSARQVVRSRPTVRARRESPCRAVHLQMNQYRRFSALCHLARVRPLLRPLVLPAPVAAHCAAHAAKIKRPADAIEVFHCASTRPGTPTTTSGPTAGCARSSEEYAHYVDIRMRPNRRPASDGRPYLELNLDGAVGRGFQPADPRHFAASATCSRPKSTSKAEIQHRDRHIDFYNSAGKKLQSRKQELQSRREGWHTITIESIDPGDESIDRAVIGLDVLRGKAAATCMASSASTTYGWPACRGSPSPPTARTTSTQQGRRHGSLRALGHPRAESGNPLPTARRLQQGAARRQRAPRRPAHRGRHSQGIRHRRRHRQRPQGIRGSHRVAPKSPATASTASSSPCSAPTPPASRPRRSGRWTAA